MVVKGRAKYIFPSVIAALATSLAALAGCSEETFVAPRYLEADVPPMEVTIDQLYAEYMADEAAAKAKYKGERLLFAGVTAEKISNFFYDPRAIEFYIKADNVKFSPKYTDDIEDIREGFVVDIVGEAQGVIFGYLIVKNCWFKVVEGGVVEKAPDY